jgi:hypothetical protein
LKFDKKILTAPPYYIYGRQKTENFGHFSEEKEKFGQKHETHEGVIDSDFIKKIACGWLSRHNRSFEFWDLSEVNPEEIFSACVSAPPTLDYPVH